MSILDQIEEQSCGRLQTGTYYLDELRPDLFEMCIVFPLTCCDTDLIETIVRNVTALMEPFGNVFYYETTGDPLSYIKKPAPAGFAEKFKGIRHGVFQMNIPRQKMTFLKKMIYVSAWISRIAVDGADFYQSSLFFWPEETEHFYSHAAAFQSSYNAWNVINGRGSSGSLKLTMDVGAMAKHFGLVQKIDEIAERLYRLYCYFDSRMENEHT